MTRWVVALMVGWALAAGCFSTGNFDELPARERATFNRCLPRMSPTVCGYEDPRAFGCQVEARRAYGNVRTARGRKRWLLESGCPPSMVDPDRYMTDDEPAPRASSPPPQPPDEPQDPPMRTLRKRPEQAPAPATDAPDPGPSEQRTKQAADPE